MKAALSYLRGETRIAAASLSTAVSQYQNQNGKYLIFSLILSHTPSLSKMCETLQMHTHNIEHVCTIFKSDTRACLEYDLSMFVRLIQVRILHRVFELKANFCKLNQDFPYKWINLAEIPRK